MQMSTACFHKLWTLILMCPPPSSPRTQLRSNVTAARRLFFSVYHASFQHPPLAELGLTALVEACRLAGLQGRCTRRRRVHHQRVRGGNRKTEQSPLRNSSRGAVKPGLNPRSRFITYSLTAMFGNPQIRWRGGGGGGGCTEGASRPSEGVRR